MIDFVSGAATNVAPATESTGATPAPSASGSCSFGDLLDAVAEEATEPASADENDGDIAAVNQWMTVPVFVPFVPLMPIEDVIESQAPVAMSIEGSEAKDISTNASVATREDVTSMALPAFPDGAAQPSMEAEDQGQPATAYESPKLEAQAVDAAVVQAQTAHLEADEAHPTSVSANGHPTALESPSMVDSETRFVPSESIVNVKAAAAGPGKAVKATSGPKGPDIDEETKPVANEMSNVPPGLAQGTTEPVQVVAAADDKTNAVEPGPRGLAARLARALEHAVQSSTPRPTAAGAEEGGYSFNSHSDNQPSLGEWLREQLPQAAAGRGHAVLSPAFSVVAPLQGEAQAYGVLAAAGHALTPPAASLPSEHDVTLQIVQSLRMQFRDGIGEAVLTLKPEHLGSVSISLRVENGGIKASVQAEAPAVRQWLESQQDTLRSALAEHGLRLDRFDVEPDARRQASEDAEERAQRKRAARKARQAEQPIFEVVV